MFEGDSTPTAIDRPVHDPWGTPHDSSWVRYGWLVSQSVKTSSHDYIAKPSIRKCPRWI